MEKPVLIYDGDCGFCRFWVARWKDMTGVAVDYSPYGEAAEKFPQIALKDFKQAVQLVEPDGTVSSGARAVFRALSYAPGKGLLLWLYDRAPGFAPGSEAVYKLIARRRPFFSALTRILWGRSTEKPDYGVSGWIFLRLLGLVYLAAFLSLGAQILGLVGGDGILPAQNFLESVRQRMGVQSYILLPTLCWWNAGDAFLKFLCWAGAGLSCFLILDAAPALTAFLLWVLYLSLSAVGQNFLWFQWDALLLEAGFLAVLLAPFRFRPSFSVKETTAGIVPWLFRWLLFRLLFQSGCVKLLSGDLHWRNLTALDFHYMTQPLPTWIAWYAHKLPAWFQSFSTAVMFGVEIVLPFLIFLPRRAKMAACAGFVLLQGLILLTGNYSFFNWLTIFLCLFLLDDAFWKDRLRPSLWARFSGPGEKAPLSHLRKLSSRLAAFFIVGLSGSLLAGMFLRDRGLPLPLEQMIAVFSPLRSVNSYGLFAVMTTERREIILEGSRDGREWLAYGFKWKPDDLQKRPAFVAPHQPRLDWQMWFAALGDYRSNPWLLGVMGHLLQGSPAVLDLLGGNPFPGEPPRYVRAVVYRYEFSDPEELRSQGAWWRRELLGLYAPVLSLRNP